MLPQQTSKATPSATSSQESGAGPSPSPSQGGLQLNLFGRAVAPASHSATLGGTGERPINATSGLSSDASSSSADLQVCLENRLRQRLDGRGSPEYALTWKHWDMGSGVPICALRASGHRTSGNDSGGWPTPTANQFEQNPEAWEKRRQRNLAKGYNGNGQGATLDIRARQAGWPTPDGTNVGDGTPYETLKENLISRRERTKKAVAEGTVLPGSGRSENLAMTAQATAGWGTPSARDGKDAGPAYEANPLIVPVGSRLPRQASGAMQSTSHASTTSRGVLNPELPRWLMGFPAEWGSYAPTATPSSRKSQRNS
jgi:hypothetical protein